MSQNTRTLLIVDDHANFRSFARRLLAGDEFEVAGEAENGESAIEAVERLHPDVVLLDVQLPDIDGFEVADRLAERSEGPRVVLTSSRAASDYGTRLGKSPISGFIPKGELTAGTLETLVTAS